MRFVFQILLQLKYHNYKAIHIKGFSTSKVITLKCLTLQGFYFISRRNDALSLYAKSRSVEDWVRL